MKSKLANMRHTLYQLKRRYPSRVSLYKRDSVQTNSETGVKSSTLSKLVIERAIVLPAREFRSFAYDLAFISANKDFTMGGFFDPNDLKIIIDKSDLPAGYKLNNDQYMLVGDRQYTLSEINEFDSGYIINGRWLRGEKVVRIEDGVDVLNIEQVALVRVTRLEFDIFDIIGINQSLGVEES